MASILQDFVVNCCHYFRLGNGENFENALHLVIKRNAADEFPQLFVNTPIKICVCSDTHDRAHLLKSIPECDIFIHCGDILMTHRFFSQTDGLIKLKRFNDWLGSIPAKAAVVIAGNHDKLIEDIGIARTQEILTNAVYLQNSSVEIFGLKFWGSPLSSGRSQNKAFQSNLFKSETESCLPHEGDIDVLVTHGSCSNLAERCRPRVAHCWGHVHEAYGAKNVKDASYMSICASTMNGRYEPVHAPILLEVQIEEQMPDGKVTDVVPDSMLMDVSLTNRNGVTDTRRICP